MKRGQRISAEIAAARLGVERGIPDLHLAIFDADGKKLATVDDSALFVQDPILSILAPKDGAYFVEVRHCMYNGSGESYFLHVGTFTRPTAIYPAGGQVGTELKVQILGDPRGVWSQSVRLPCHAGRPGVRRHRSERRRHGSVAEPAARVAVPQRARDRAERYARGRCFEHHG